TSISSVRSTSLDCSSHSTRGGSDEERSQRDRRPGIHTRTRTEGPGAEQASRSRRQSTPQSIAALVDTRRSMPHRGYHRDGLSRRSAVGRARRGRPHRKCYRIGRARQTDSGLALATQSRFVTGRIKYALKLAGSLLGYEKAGETRAAV